MPNFRGNPKKLAADKALKKVLKFLYKIERMQEILRKNKVS